MYCRVKWLSTDVSEVRTSSIIRDEFWKKSHPLPPSASIWMLWDWFTFQDNIWVWWAVVEWYGQGKNPTYGGSTHLWNVGRQSFYTAVCQKTILNKIKYTLLRTLLGWNMTLALFHNLKSLKYILTQKIFYPLAQLYVTNVYLNLFGVRVTLSSSNILTGGGVTGYKIFGKLCCICRRFSTRKKAVLT
jgi:hypothetical protein